MGQKVLKQTIECQYNRKVELTVYNDGTIVISGARQVNVVHEIENMDYDMQKLAPNSSIAVMVQCGPDSIEAEMVRHNAPWVGIHEVPKISAIFLPLTSGEIRVHCSDSPSPIPIAPTSKVAV